MRSVLFAKFICVPEKWSVLLILFLSLLFFLCYYIYDCDIVLYLCISYILYSTRFPPILRLFTGVYLLCDGGL